MSYRVIKAIGIIAKLTILFTFSIHTIPYDQSRIIISRPIIVPVQAMGSVQFLTIVLITLTFTLHAAAHQATCRIVVVHLHDVSIGIQHDTVVAKMVFQVIIARNIAALITFRIPNIIEYSNKTFVIDDISTVVLCRDFHFLIG